MKLAKPIKNLLCCLGIASVAFTACKKNDNTSVTPFTEGYYTGTVISSSVLDGNKTQTVLPANINFVGGNYTENNLTLNQLAYIDFIPFNGTYELQNENTTLVLTYAKVPLYSSLAPGFLTGSYAISYKADSLILTQNLSDGTSSYQFRLKKFSR